MKFILSFLSFQGLFAVFMGFMSLGLVGIAKDYIEQEKQAIRHEAILEGQWMVLGKLSIDQLGEINVPN